MTDAFLLGMAVPSLSDVVAPDPVSAAATWAANVMLGTVATMVAVTAVAAVGLMTLSGRIHWRQGASVVLGCFVLFGAPVIAESLRGLTGSNAPTPTAFTAAAPLALIALPKPTPFDPYAGAAPAPHP